MKVISAINDLRESLSEARRQGRSIGFVPTMGYLHDGHLTLARWARRNSDVVVVSIFVNPTQFGPTEDYDAYPRDLDRDRLLLEGVEVDFLFAPSVAEMFPTPSKTVVDVPCLGSLLEGALRPDYFRGVATVVSKLLNIVQPTTAFFGEKDYQQVLVIRQLAKDLSFPVEIVSVPTVRDEDGLALSSRNVYLAPEQRRASLRLNLALTEAKSAIRRGIESPAALEAQLRRYLSEEPLAQIEMIAVRDADTLEKTEAEFPDRVLVLLMVRFGKAQLLDHVVVDRRNDGN